VSGVRCRGEGGTVTSLSQLPAVRGPSGQLPNRVYKVRSEVLTKRGKK
jgi:hypothetical protein